MRILPFVYAGCTAGMAYALADVVSQAIKGRPMDLTVLIIPLYIALATVGVTAISAGLGWLARKTIDFSMPRGGRIVWGGSMGLVMCLLMDLPNLNFTRWLPYAMALVVGVVVAFVYNSATAASRSRGILLQPPG